MNAPPMENPPALGAEGQSIAVGANAVAIYEQNGTSDKAAEWPWNASKVHTKPKGRRITFQDAMGRVWRYPGKKGRVLAMLATSRNGITQFSTLPWHTRLGGTIHAMRQDGLTIETEREGEYRHARYRLCTVGQLIEGSDR